MTHVSSLSSNDSGFSKTASFSTKSLALILLCLLLGAINIFAFAPTFYWWLSIISLSGFFILIRSAATAKQAFSISFLYFLAYFLPFVAWVEEPLLRIFIIFTALWMTVLHTVWVGYLSWLTRRLPPGLHLIAYSLLWGSGEWLRGHLLSGIPWNLLSYIVFFNEALVQTAAWWGSYGLIIPIVFILTSPALIILQPKRLMTWLIVLFSSALLMLAYFYGVQRLHQYPVTYWPDLTLRLVQANFHAKDVTPKQTNPLFYKYLKQTFEDNPQNINVFIWPEAALNHFYVNETVPEFKKYNRFMSRINERLPENSLLITGLQRVTMADKPKLTLKTLQHGVAVISHQGLVAWYPKHHLVPFAEYMPLLNSFGVRNLLSIVSQEDKLDYTPGLGPTIMNIPLLPPFSPAICFESIFPNEIVPRNGEKRPDWILVISNDAWYANTRYPLWLLQMARMRAVEEGLSLIRVANAGMSAVIDGTGRILNSLPANTFGNMDTQLPRPLPVLTLYARYGDHVFLGMLLAGMLILFMSYFVYRFYSSTKPSKKTNSS